MVERIWKSKARAREEDSQWKASEGFVEDGEPGTGESRVDKGREAVVELTDGQAQGGREVK